VNDDQILADWVAWCVIPFRCVDIFVAADIE